MSANEPGLPPAKSWVDGLPATGISVCDRSAQFGDGLFETFAVVEGRLPLWSRHLDRLLAGCRRLGLPAIDAIALTEEIASVLAGEAGQGVAKLILSRGESLRGYRIPEEITPRRILTLRPWPGFPAKYWQEGVCVRLCQMRLGSQPLLAGLKHLNRLEQVLARAEWSDPEIAEGLMMDASGRLVEGTMSNLFLRIGAEVHTAPLSDSGVAGVMRGWVIDELLAMRQPLRLEAPSLSLLMHADEIWLSNSIFGIWPVSRMVEGHGSGWKPGPLTMRLQSAALVQFPWLGHGYAEQGPSVASRTPPRP